MGLLDRLFEARLKRVSGYRGPSRPESRSRAPAPTPVRDTPAPRPAVPARPAPSRQAPARQTRTRTARPTGKRFTYQTTEGPMTSDRALKPKERERIARRVREERARQARNRTR